jgi:hypothetical protein
MSKKDVEKELMSVLWVDVNWKRYRAKQQSAIVVEKVI